jgi:hypothetical protein
MSIRPNQSLHDEHYPDLPEVEPMEVPDHLAELVDEFCARNASRPSLSLLPLESASGVAFSLGEGDDAPLFAFELSLRSVRFMSGVDFDHTPESPEVIRVLFAEVWDGVAFGELSVTEDGAQWGWTAPAVRYPYFHGIAMHAIAYAEYLSDKFWPVVRELAEGKTTVAEACVRVKACDEV